MPAWLRGVTASFTQMAYSGGASAHPVPSYRNEAGLSPPELIGSCWRFLPVIGRSNWATATASWAQRASCLDRHYRLLKSSSKTYNEERRYTGRRMALDVGASPGGWSYCLAQRLCTCHVIACDPAAYMHPLVRRLSVEGTLAKSKTALRSQRVATKETGL